MNGKEFEILMDWCDIKLDGSGHITITPRLDSDKEFINNIIEKNCLSDISLDRFKEICSEHASAYNVRKRIKQKKLSEYSDMSSNQVANLPLEEKINYIELLFPHIQSMDDLTNTCKNNKDKIKSCMFHMDFPESFWKKEKQLADRYASLIAKSPDMLNSIENWQNLPLDDKKQVVLKSADIFKYIYGDVPEIVFLTTKEEKTKRQQEKTDENEHVWAAYYSCSDKKIYFNTERLQNSDNFFAPSVMLHEGTHFRQDIQNFDDALVDRIFRLNIGRTAMYENKSAGAANDFSDFYVMQPKEIHAYGVQEYMENILTEKTGIRKRVQPAQSKDISCVHNKAFIMAKISQYHSSK